MRSHMILLIKACHVGHYNIISFLLQVGADPNLSTPLGLSPLGLVAASGNFDCVSEGGNDR